MQPQYEPEFPNYSHQGETGAPQLIENIESAEVEDADPPLDEEDLEENGLTVEQADQIVWDPPTKGSAGGEEKDITD